jgi:hypothetical protein
MNYKIYSRNVKIVHVKSLEQQWVVQSKVVETRIIFTVLNKVVENSLSLPLSHDFIVFVISILPSLVPITHTHTHAHNPHSFAFTFSFSFFTFSHWVISIFFPFVNIRMKEILYVLRIYSSILCLSNIHFTLKKKCAMCGGLLIVVFVTWYETRGTKSNRSVNRIYWHSYLSY